MVLNLNQVGAQDLTLYRISISVILDDDFFSLLLIVFELFVYGGGISGFSRDFVMRS